MINKNQLAVMASTAIILPVISATIYASEEPQPLESTERTTDDFDAVSKVNKNHDSTELSIQDGLLNGTHTEQQFNQNDDIQKVYKNRTNINNENLLENVKNSNYFTENESVRKSDSEKESTLSNFKKSNILDEKSIHVLNITSDLNQKTNNSHNFEAADINETIDTLEIDPSLKMVSGRSQDSAFINGKLKYNVIDTILNNVSVSINDTNYEGSIIIPETVQYNFKKYTVTKIEKNGFAGCGNLTEVVTPKTITNIEEGAFFDCKNLRKVTLNEGLKILGDTYPFGVGVFQDCKNLTEINLPSTLTLLGRYTFYGTKLLSLMIPQNIETFYIGNAPETLQSIIFNSGVKIIEEGALAGCKELTKVELPDTVREIRRFAFMNCESLQSIVIPKTVTKLESEAFSGCKNLRKVTLNEGLISLDDAFSNCENLISVDLPETLATIGSSAFSNCFKLQDLYIPKNVKTIGESAFENCASLKEVKYGGTINDWNLIEIGKYNDKLLLATRYYNQKKEPVSFNFVDVNKNLWYCDWITQAYKYNIMTGLDSTHFGPNNLMTRGMVATVLYRMENSPKVEFKQKFSDVKKGLWFSDAITWASDQGIISGYQSGKFGPSDNITREQMAVMIRNYLNKKSIKTISNESLDRFKDNKQVSDYARSAMQFCVEKGILSGAENGTKLNPGNYATRAECAKLLVNTKNLAQNARTSLVLNELEIQPKLLSMKPEINELSLAKESNNPFNDVMESDWYYNVVIEANSKKLVTGLNTNTFGPNQNMTRGMMATVLYRMAGAPNQNSLMNRFADVKDGIWYTNVIIWASDSQIMNGYGNQKFGPNDLITREQMAVVLRNLMLKMGYQSANTNYLSNYRDSSKVSSFAESAVEFCLANGLMSGTADGKKINPSNNATRAECAKMTVLANKKLESLNSSNLRIKINLGRNDNTQYCYLPHGTKFYSSTVPFVAPGSTDYILDYDNETIIITVFGGPSGPINSKKEFEATLKSFKSYQIYESNYRYYASISNEWFDYKGNKKYQEGIVFNENESKS